MGEQSDASGTAGRYGYHGHHHKGGTADAGGHDVRDPVCGVRLDPHMTEHKSVFRRQVYYFHSAACRAAFEAEPGRYADGLP